MFRSLSDVPRFVNYFGLFTAKSDSLDRLLIKYHWRFSLFWPTEYLTAHMNQTDDWRQRRSCSFYFIQVSVSPFYSFLYFFPSSQDDLVPRERSMFGLKRAVKSNCQAALFDGVLSLTDLSVKDNHCQQTQIWDLTFSLQRRAFSSNWKVGLFVM